MCVNSNTKIKFPYSIKYIAYEKDNQKICKEQHSLNVSVQAVRQFVFKHY